MGLSTREERSSTGKTLSSLVVIKTDGFISLIHRASIMSAADTSTS